ncbi:MAG: CARDB domain-containing protein, partial [Gemmatimonadales bacterium]
MNRDEDVGFSDTIMKGEEMSGATEERGLVRSFMHVHAALTDRIVLGALLASAALLVACEDPQAPLTGKGNLVINVTSGTEVGPNLAAGDSEGPRLGASALSSVSVELEGPTPINTNLALNASNQWEGTIGNLDPGQYTVTLIGRNSQSQVEQFGNRSGVSVIADQTTSANISNWRTFLPTITTAPSQTTSFSVDVSWSSVTNATGYIFEWADNPGFTGATAETLTATTTTIDLPNTGSFFVRARATNAKVPSGGAAGTSAQIDLIEDATGAPDPLSAQSQGSGPFTTTLTGLNISPADEVDWFAFDACSFDLATIEVTADRLTPPSPLDPVVFLFRSFDGTEVASNDDFFTGSTDARVEDVVLPADELYWIAVVSFNSESVGHYELLIDVVAGPNNQGGGVCGAVDLVPTSVSAPTQPTPLQGEIVRVDLTVDNTGSTDAPVGWNYDIRLSTNNIISTGDIFLTSYVENVTIGAAGSRSVSIATVLPTDVTPGLYFVGVIVDGSNGVGELDESNNNLAAASTIDILPAVAWSPDFAGGWDHSCRLNASLNAECWGLNLSGQLGDGSTNNSSAPVAVQGGPQFVQIATGQWHTCGIDPSYKAWCWGSNSSGQVGDPSTVGTDVFAPTMVDGGHSFVRLAAGLEHTCGITMEGKIYCWGRGDQGQLGDALFSNSATPVQADPGGQVFFFTDVTAGIAHTCGIQANQALWCWGLNDEGEFGDGTTNSTGDAVNIVGASGAAIHAGRDHTCHINGIDGTLWCTGRGSEGQLGDGTFTNTLTFVNVPGTWMGFDASGQHTCGVLGDA